MQIGCHISIGKGLEKATETALEIGANAFQVFTKNPRGLRPKKVNVKDAEKGVALCRENNITVVCHT